MEKSTRCLLDVNVSYYMDVCMDLFISPPRCILGPARTHFLQIRECERERGRDI